MTTMSRIAVGVLLLGVSGSACGGAPPPKAEEPESVRHEEPKAAKPAPMKMAGELGQIDPALVKKTIAGLAHKFEACQSAGMKRVEMLGGTAEFFLRVTASGGAKWVYLTASDVGDRDTEKCLLDAASSATWPKPDEGEAEVHFSQELAVQSARPATDWSPEKVGAVLSKRRGAVDKCGAAGDAPWTATLYIGEGGKVLSAGVAAPNQEASAKADCVASALKAMKGFPSPGSWPAKVTTKL